MDIREITPWLALYTPIGGTLAVTDFVLREHHKEKVFNAMLRIAEAGKKPLSAKCYVAVVSFSAVFTAAIIFLNGLVHYLTGESDSSTIGLKSIAPILIGIIFKIVIFDYLLVLKTHFLLWLARQSYNRGGSPSIKLTRCVDTIIFFCDFIFSALATGFVIKWWESRQLDLLDSSSKQISDIPGLSFFDQLSFLVQDSSERAFYALNGTLIIYMLMIFSSISRGITSHLNTEEIKKNVFKIIAAFGAFIVLIVATCRTLAAA